MLLNWLCKSDSCIAKLTNVELAVVDDDAILEQVEFSYDPEGAGELWG